MRPEILFGVLTLVWLVAQGLLAFSFAVQAIDRDRWKRIGIRTTAVWLFALVATVVINPAFWATPP